MKSGKRERLRYIPPFPHKSILTNGSVRVYVPKLYSVNPSYQASVSRRRGEDLAIADRRESRRSSHRQQSRIASQMLNPNYRCHDKKSELAHSQRLSDMPQETQNWEVRQINSDGCKSESSVRQGKEVVLFLLRVSRSPITWLLAQETMWCGKL